MRKTKSEGKTVGIFAISSQTVRNVLRISQCEKSQRISQCEISQCENHIANFAMRKTTLRISQCEKPQRISQCENHIANFAMRKENFAMPNGCQLIANCLRKFQLCFFFKICSKISKKTTKLMQEKLHKSKN